MFPYQILERKFSEYIGVSDSVAVSTGTAALHVALEALELPKDSEVLVPEYTMIATAWAVTYAGLKPVFVDCDDDLLIDISKIEALITEKTKVLMLTHIYGRVVDMDAIMEIARKYKLRVIEDAAEAHGCEWRGRKVGSYDIGCFSFYRNKIVCGEEGGIVTSDDKNFISIVNDMKSMSFGSEHNYHHKRIGFNYRMTDSQANLIIKSLKNVEKNISLRRKKQELYDNLIDNTYHMGTRDVPWVYDICVPKNKKNLLVKRLQEAGIAARHGFKPVSSSAPFYKNGLPNSLKYSENILYLPLGENETEERIAKIAEVVNTWLEVMNV
jgi:dTDP-4-amino-4,6-dideoxygalactose transaminase